MLSPCIKTMQVVIKSY
uniref:Uncharacterized protein n=1 Tax=Zea mays TaxID=4577 RepID=B4FC16_MAIZE|nr:unknown [Zea mays]